MSRGRPDHERRNMPFPAGLRHRWWCDLVMRKRRGEFRNEPVLNTNTIGPRKSRRNYAGKKNQQERWRPE